MSGREILRRPPEEVDEATVVGSYLAWLRRNRGLEPSGYEELWRWSVSDLEGFWTSIWEFFEVRASVPAEAVPASREMPGARWFPGARLNYAENLLGGPAPGEASAVVSHSQTRDPVELTFAELREQVARARLGLERLGIERGDRVAGYLPNIPETLVAFLATVSLGAVWTACAPELGPRSVVDRLAAVRPKLLLAISGYRYGTRTIDRRAEVARVRGALDSLEHVIHVPYLGGAEDELPETVAWSGLLADEGPLTFAQLPFEHPLCILSPRARPGRRRRSSTATVASCSSI